MKTLSTICLLAISATAMAQTTRDAGASDEKARSARTEAQSEAEEAKTRKQLEDARQRLDKAARDVAELSTKLGERTRGQVMRRFETLDGPRRAVLGVQIESDPARQGARVLSVSPGGAAEKAGLRDKDVIVAIDGVELTGAAPDRTLVTKMREVRPDQKVKVRVLRDGKKKDYVVIARPVPYGHAYHMVTPEAGSAVAGGFGPAPMIQHFRRFMPGEFEGLELASITPKLGAYFGVTEGVLVVQAPKDGALKLEDGDVLQSIDGRKPDDGAHALRILRSYRSGEQLNLTVLRQRKPVNVAVTMPDRPDGDFFHFDGPAPVIAPLPPEPGVPGAPLPPPGPGAFE